MALEFECLTQVENGAAYTNNESCDPYGGECWPGTEEGSGQCGPDCNPN